MENRETEVVWRKKGKIPGLCSQQNDHSVSGKERLLENGVGRSVNQNKAPDGKEDISEPDMEMLQLQKEKSF